MINLKNCFNFAFRHLPVWSMLLLIQSFGRADTPGRPEVPGKPGGPGEVVMW